MGSNYKLEYNVDIVLCIDKTGSMDGLLDMVKKRALFFYNDLMKLMERKGKKVSSLRMKVIFFGDYLADGDSAMLSSDFYNMPDDAELFQDIVQSVNAEGGGDDPEDGLEALCHAIRSSWTKSGNKRRHVIVVWTDASTHELGFAQSAPNYPKSMPKTFSELTELWDSGEYIDNEAKRLLLYAPKEKYWSNIASTWDGVIHYESEAGEGLKEFEYDEILNVIANSI